MIRLLCKDDVRKKRKQEKINREFGEFNYINGRMGEYANGKMQLNPSRFIPFKLMADLYALIIGSLENI